MMQNKIKFIFETADGEIVTNDKIFNKEKSMDDWEDEEFENCGCIVIFDTIPMLQDYQKIVNSMWLRCLQFSTKGSDHRLKKVETILIDK